MSRLKIYIEMKTVELPKEDTDRLKKVKGKRDFEKNLAKRLIREFDGSVVTVNTEVIE